ncbi:hypothetical protein C4565_09900 [Candidatus Parcubacteria bacterium]|nr:MAG: hypothetical protein C4565_09900 [Candidatus Parcubacteria bacterium]
MAYTLECSQRHFFVLRRIAWGYNASMGETLHKIIEDWVSQNDSRFICESCKDKSFCPSCFMKKHREKAQSK